MIVVDTQSQTVLTISCTIWTIVLINKKTTSTILSQTKNLVPSPFPIFYVAPMIESFNQTSMIGTACIERGPAEFFN